MASDNGKGDGMTYAEALYSFWSSFTDDGAPITAYLSGNAPDDALFPYITFEHIQGSAFGRVSTMAFVWIKQVPGVNVRKKRDAFFSQVKEAIPESGRVLHYDGGIAVLYRSRDNFVSSYNPPDKEGTVTGMPVRGGRVGYEIAFYGE